MTAQLFPAIADALPNSAATERRALRRGLERSLALYYPLPGEHRTVVDVAERCFPYLEEN